MTVVYVVECSCGFSKELESLVDAQNQLSAHSAGGRNGPNTSHSAGIQPTRRTA